MPEQPLLDAEQARREAIERDMLKLRVVLNYAQAIYTEYEAETIKLLESLIKWTDELERENKSLKADLQATKRLLAEVLEGD
jgi:hypothetical protein